MSSEHKSPETEERLGVVRSEGSTGGQVESALGTGGGSFLPSQVVAGAIAAAARAAADGVDSPAGDVASTTQSSADVGVAESSGFPTQSHARALASSGDRQPELGRADDQVQAHVMSRLAHMSVGAAAGGEPSEGTTLASENAEKIARLEQGQTNIVAQLTEIAGLLKNFRPESGQDGSRGPGGSGGLGLVPASSPWGGGAGGGASVPARSNAKEEARREATIWQAKYNQTLWVLRGQRGPEPGPQKEDLQGLMSDIVHVTGDVLAQMRAFSSFDVKSFRPVGVARTSSIADNFDVMCEAVMRLLKFGLDSSTTAGVQSLRRLEPIATAMADARSRFRTTLVRNSDVFPDEYQRAALPRLPNEDFKLWTTAIITWMYPFTKMHYPPDAFDGHTLPPVPEFPNINNFCERGVNLFRLVLSDGGSLPGTGESRGGSGKRKAGQLDRGDSSSRKRVTRECFQFRDSGTCSFGDKCRFEHVKRRDSSSTGSGGGGGGSRGGGGRSSAGGQGGGVARGGGQADGGDGGGSSSALAVRGGSK
ncbi:unnamed protein product [Ectocarpus sp. CCAP 1310/34]|nr:unnamed protein product [Ectocarpus sp. CCAP 1310/34]